MRTRGYLVVSVLLAVLAGFVTGSLHLVHEHDNPIAAADCPVCSFVLNPALDCSEWPLVTELVASDRIPLPLVPIAFLSLSTSACGPRSPPAVGMV